MYKCSRCRIEQMKFVEACVGGHLVQLVWPVSKVQLGICSQDISPHSMAIFPHVIEPFGTDLDGLQQYIKKQSSPVIDGTRGP